MPASFLGTACSKKMAKVEYSNYPEACLSIDRDFFMDDYLDGAMDKADALRLRDNITSFMKRVGLKLRKWMSNDKE